MWVGQFHTFKSHSYVHDRITHENPLHSVPHHSHAYAPCTLEGRVPIWRTHIQFMYDMFTRESESMHTPFSVTFFFTFTYESYRSIYICKSDQTHLHMHKQLDTSYQLHMYRQLLRNVACPSYTHAIPLLSR